MKLFIGIIVSVLLVQALAFPTVEDPLKPEAIETEPKNDIVDEFRTNLMTQFRRFQTFYDLFVAQMNQYRMRHVDLVREIGEELMEVFAFDLDLIRESKDYSNAIVEGALERLGGQPNACLNEVLDLLSMNSGRLGEQFNACSVRANRTVSNALRDIFYPTFDQTQRSASLIPILTLGSLARGNVFDDNEAIINYLDSQFRVVDLQWKQAASQLFRWETARFDVEGRFYVEEMNDCLRGVVENYMNSNIVYNARIVDECAPM